MPLWQRINIKERETERSADFWTFRNKVKFGFARPQKEQLQLLRSVSLCGILIRESCVIFSSLMSINAALFSSLLAFVHADFNTRSQLWGNIRNVNLHPDFRAVSILWSVLSNLCLSAITLWSAASLQQSDVPGGTRSSFTFKIHSQLLFHPVFLVAVHQQQLSLIRRIHSESSTRR